ncbi:MAG: hypothetical protein KTR15_03915 [Phycisphaeraceae bacterium]|nr:hypothetical protein [Phycisphaeraceae bacterium]
MSCDLLTKNRSLIDNLGFNYHHYATDYGVGRGSANCGSCASGLSGSSGLMELLIERRHRSRNMTELGSFGPGVYTNYDTKLFLNEIDGGLQLDIFDPRELRSKRLTDGIDGDALDGRFLDHRNASLREARLLDAQDVLTSNLNNAVAIEVEAYNGYVHRFELIDLAGDTTDNTALVGHWRFDEASGSIAEDSTSENNDGTVSGAARVAVSGAPIPGGAGGALDFDGVDDSVNLGSPAVLNISGEITMSAWINPDSIASNPNDPFGISTVVSHVHGSNSEPNAVFIRLRHGQYQAGSWDGLINHMAALEIPAEDEGQWVHLAAVYDGAAWRLYRNGRLAAVSQAVTGAISSSQEWRIGSASWNGVSRQHFDGQIDDVRIYNRNVLEGEIAQIAKQRVLAGRLASVKDRNGYGTSITYRDGDFTPAQLDESPERRWQINTVTDAYGRVATFNYKNTQIAGQWVVERIDLPNGEDVEYLYEDGLHLTKVVHADGTESTFTYTPDAGTQTMKVSYDDASARGTHRHKTAYLTNQIIIPALDKDLKTAEIFNQSSMMIRMLVNGSDEVSYLNFQDPNGINKNAIYEGAGKLRHMNGNWLAPHYGDGWTLGDPSQGFDAIQGGFEDSTASVLYNSPGLTNREILQKGVYRVLRDDHEQYYYFTYDADSFKTNKSYSDGSSEQWAYNDFKQVTTHTDRLGRQTVKTYDANGNLLTRKLGVINGVDQPEVATYSNTYYNGAEGPAVAGITGAASPQPVGLLKSSTDANGNTTNYVYNSNNFLIAEIEPADSVAGLPTTAVGSQSAQRAITLFSYDTAGRLSSTTDPLGRVTSFTYDSRDRQKITTYHDGSTEEVFYANELAGGAGSDANLVVAMKDRNDNYTQYRYDAHGRRFQTISGITTQADALDQSLIPDTTYHSVEICEYLAGTDLKSACTRNGERTEYVYDYRQRLVKTTRFVRNTGGTFPFATGGNLIDFDGDGTTSDDDGVLSTYYIYKKNLLYATVDPYGRATFHAYRAADNARIRTVSETTPGSVGLDFVLGGNQDVLNLTRDLTFEGLNLANITAGTSGGADYLINDSVLDDERQTISRIDPRNIQHDTEYDSRGRVTASVTAVGTPTEARTETIYDANSNVIEQRSARYFDSTDTGGFNKARATMQYTGRNTLAARVLAPGTPEEGTETFTYFLDGRAEKTTDFNGNAPAPGMTAADHEWLTIWRQCCERVRAMIDPEGHGRAMGHDFAGNVTHTAAVEDLVSDIVTAPNGVPTIANSDDGGPGVWDAPDTRTLSETTTRFDSKNRPVANTVWLEPLGKVDPNDAPILYGGAIEGGTNAQTAATGLTTGDGLTTLYYYSEDIYETPVVSTAGVEGPPTRAAGQDNAFLVHQFAAAPAIDLNPTLNKLDALGIDLFETGVIDDKTNASARAMINAEGEISVTIMDGLGRAVISAMLNPTNFQPVTWSTVSHDRVVTVNGLNGQASGLALETLSISALNHLNRSITDGVGRTVQAIDAEGNAALLTYDNNGNAIRTRNANAVGQDCVFDARNRDTVCTDTQGDTTSRLYNANNQVLKVTDAKGVSNQADTVYDARGRVTQTTSRLAVSDTNEASYDPNSNLLTQTDAQGGVTTYEYDTRNLRTATLMPGHNPTSVVGDSDYDRAEMTYDAMRRPLLKTDQEGDTCVYSYDLASRLLTRDYRTAANSTPLTDGLPTGTIADTDTFTYDDVSRPLTAIKGRYSNTVAFAYDNIGRPTSEALTTNGQTYTTGYTNYDDDSRLTILAYPDGSTVATTYTDRNQAEDIDYTPSGGTATTIATMSYDPGMRNTLRELGNSLEVTRAYRGTTSTAGDNMLESITVESSPGAADRQALTFDYSYDANKNVLSETRAPGNPANASYPYSYTRGIDAKDRLTSWTRVNTTTALDSQSWNLSFESDWDDTTLTDGGTGTTQTRTHNDPHELLTIDPDGAGVLPAFSQTHDAKGNLTADGDGMAHTFDFDNMLSQTVVAGASPRGIEGTHSYEYDALGRRVSKTVTPTSGSATTTVFVCAGQQVIAEYTGGTADTDPDRKYIFCATGYIDDPVAMIDATGVSEDTYYYHRDRQFSIIGLTDDTGTPVERYTYTAYGEVTIHDGTGVTVRTASLYANPYTYTGRRLDDETGLHYFRARYHDAVLGRFLERDPLGYPDGLNTYAAYHVMWGGVDPMGLEWEDQGENIWKASEDGDTLQELAKKISGDEEDWQCIWIPSEWKDSSTYPVASCDDTADVSNLLPLMTELKNIVISHDLFAADVPDAKYVEPTSFPAWIRDTSSEGGTPIGYMVIHSHGRAGATFLGGIDAAGGRHEISVADITKLSKPATYKRAKEKKGPSRCWFTRGASVYSAACHSNAYAKEFADKLLRKGGHAYGTDKLIIVKKALETYSENGVDAKGRILYKKEDSFFAAPIWTSYEGGL